MSTAKDRAATRDRPNSTDRPGAGDRPGVGLHHVTVVPGNARKDRRRGGRGE